MPHPTDDLADNWCALARKVLNQALRDARLPSRRYEVADFAESDWAALLCEVVGVGWRPYMRAALRAVEGGGCPDYDGTSVLDSAPGPMNREGEAKSRRY